MRSEIISRSNTQSSLITLAVTALGIVAGFVIKDSGDIRLLLILPFLMSAAGIHSAQQDRAISMMGTYIRDALWPHLTRQVEEVNAPGEFPSWEQTASDFRQGSKHQVEQNRWSSVLLSSIPGTLIFGLGSMVPLVLVFVANHGLDKDPFEWDIYRAVWWMGVGLVAIFAMLARSAWLRRPLWETLKGYDECGRRIGERL